MVAFVVLNYKNFDDTKICVDSLIKFSAEKAKIVVVDNHSDDESFCRLTELYKSEKNVEIVQNKQNFGFSKGNNIGCKIAMEKFNADFLCIINNDTYIDDGEFCEKIEEIHAETNFDILAPCVWNTRKNFNQNPFMVPSNEKELKTEIENIEKGLKILKFGAIPYWIYGHLCNSLTCVLCWWGGVIQENRLVARHSSFREIILAGTAKFSWKKRLCMTKRHLCTRELCGTI